MIALGGPKLKHTGGGLGEGAEIVSMIALGGPKLKPFLVKNGNKEEKGFNDSTGWA